MPWCKKWDVSHRERTASRLLHWPTNRATLNNNTSPDLDWGRPEYRPGQTRPEQSRAEIHSQPGQDGWVLFNKRGTIRRKKKKRTEETFAYTHEQQASQRGNTTIESRQNHSSPRAVQQCPWVTRVSVCSCMRKNGRGWLRWVVDMYSSGVSVCTCVLADSLPGAGLVLAVAVERATWEGVEIVFTSWSWLSTDERRLTAPWNEPLRLNVLTTSICRTKTKQQHFKWGEKVKVWVCTGAAASSVQVFTPF